MVSAPDKFRITRIEELHDVKVLVYQSGILEVEWDDELKEIDLESMQQVMACIRKIGNGKKMCVYMSVNEFVTITMDALSYAASDECSELAKANAFLVDNLAKKLVFNFYLRVNKPSVLTKTFSLKEEAFDWLLTQLD